MGLCLADSLLVCDGYSGSDVRKRFWNWWFRGYNNAFRLEEGRCDSVGLGGNIKSSLSRMPPEPTPRFEELGGNQDAGNGSLMRLSPVPVYFHRDPAVAARVSSESSLTTHPGPIAADACSFLGFAIARAINRPEGDRANAAQFLDECCEAYQALPDARGQATLLQLLAASEPPGSTERCWNWRDPDGPYLLETLEARGSSYNGYPVLPDYFGSYSMDGLALALHSIYHTSTFMAAIARCINFLGDSDSHGAICGQLAGAFYGATAIDERLVAAVEVWDQGEIALRAALLHSLGAELSEDAVAAAMAATAQDAEPTVAKKPKTVEAPSPGAWVPPSVAKKKKQEEEEEEASKHIIEVMATGDDRMSGFAVYPRTHCPHLKQYGELPKPSCISMKARCSVCGEDEVWICAFCGASLCSRYKNAHMLQHSAEEDHPVGLSLSDLSFWCFKCDSYLDVFAIKALHPLYSEAHVAKFGEAPPLPSSAQLPDPGSSSSSSSSML
jgi:ADP-ribosylglycohydrolase